MPRLSMELQDINSPRQADASSPMSDLSREEYDEPDDLNLPQIEEESDSDDVDLSAEDIDYTQVVEKLQKKLSVSKAQKKQMKGELDTLKVRVPKFRRDSAVERDLSALNLEFKPLPLNKY